MEILLSNKWHLYKKDIEWKDIVLPRPYLIHQSKYKNWLDENEKRRIYVLIVWIIQNNCSIYKNIANKDSKLAEMNLHMFAAVYCSTYLIGENRWEFISHPEKYNDPLWYSIRSSWWNYLAQNNFYFKVKFYIFKDKLSHWFNVIVPGYTKNLFHWFKSIGPRCIKNLSFCFKLIRKRIFNLKFLKKVLLSVIVISLVKTMVIKWSPIDISKVWLWLVFILVLIINSIF